MKLHNKVVAITGAAEKLPGITRAGCCYRYAVKQRRMHTIYTVAREGLSNSSRFNGNTGKLVCIAI